MSRLATPVRLSAVALLAALVLGSSSVAALGLPPPTVTTGVGGAALSVYHAASEYTAFVLADCGNNPPNECQLWVTRNGNGIETEALVANVHGTLGSSDGHMLSGEADVPFPDGCLNLRLYRADNHTAAGFLVGQNVGIACNADLQGYGTGKAVLNDFPTSSAGGAPQVRYDSGYLVNVDVAEIWVQEASGGTQSCAGATFGPEVLLTQNTGGITGIGNIGGGPYRFHIYFGTEHRVETAPAVCIATSSYLNYAPPSGIGATILFFNTGFSFVNGLVCVYGPAVPGSSATNQTPFTFNSHGWNPGGTTIPFQRVGSGTNTYTLRAGVTTDASGAPTADACATGAPVTTTTITT